MTYHSDEAPDEQICALANAVANLLHGTTSQAVLGLSDAIYTANLDGREAVQIGEIFLQEGMTLDPSYARWRLAELVLRMPIFDRASTQWAKWAAQWKRKGDDEPDDPLGELKHYLNAEAKQRASEASNMEREILAAAMLVRLPKNRARRLMEAINEN